MASCGQSLLDQEDFAYDNQAAMDAVDVAVDSAAKDVADTAGDVAVDTGTDAGVKDTAVEPECLSDFDCLDIKGKTPCRLPSCNKGVCELKQLAKDTACTHPLVTLKECERTLCDDKGECAVGHRKDGDHCGFGACGKLCKAGACVTAQPDDYNDNNPCTKDFCKQGTEIVHEPISDVGYACDDGDPCTESEYCAAGSCVGAAVDCSDGLNCTMDSCVKDKGCQYTPDTKQCDDGDPCTKDGCDLSEGCTVVSVNVGAKCDDLNACSDTDVCNADGECGGKAICDCKEASDCDPKNLCIPMVCDAGKCEVDQGKTVACDKELDTECTKNSCDPTQGKCVPHPIAEGLVCDDGNACTAASTCKKGECIGSGTVDCDDKVDCTSDACSPVDGCQHVVKNEACDDKDPCTEDDACTAGGCFGKTIACDDGVACTLDACDSSTGKCTHKPQDAPCNDDNPCSADICDAKAGCTNKPAADGKCDDGDACTKDACDKGKCVVAEYLCQCKKNADCDDKNPCTKDTCGGGKCKNVNEKDGQACDTADKCNVAGSGVCKAGTCTGGKAIDCSKGVGPCTVSSCDPSAGKCVTVNKPDDTPCDGDKDGCTESDACTAGKCVIGPKVDCSGDGDTCNKASCKSEGVHKFKCVVEPLAKGTACEDGNFCIVLETCDGKGACKGTTMLTCSEYNDACNLGKCDNEKGECFKKPKIVSIPCDDGEWCTLEDHCDGKGICIGGKKRICPDDNCKVGQCDDGDNSCKKVPAAAGVLCDDGNKCTGTDKCDAASKCVGSSPKSCPNAACKLGYCDTQSGDCKLKSDKDGTVCNDGNACTDKDACKAGSCTGGSPKTCTGDACNTGSCNTSSGVCEKKPKSNGTSCTDNQACTDKDTCQAGVCKPGAYTCDCTVNNDCNDKNGCTKDVCATVSGKKVCQNTVNKGIKCDDKKNCTKSDACDSKGVCVGQVVKCNDNNQCTNDFCDTSNGNCVYKNQSGKGCSDGNPCTSGDKCDSKSKCVGKNIVCNDGNACTNDSCSKGKCVYAPKSGGSCSDGNICTVSDTCASGKCAGKAKDCNDGNHCTTDSCDTKKGCQHKAVSAGKTCGSNKVCVNTTCTCRLGLNQKGSGDHEMLFDVAPTLSGGAIMVGRKFKGGADYDGYCRSFGAFPNSYKEVLIGASSKMDELKAVGQFGNGTYLAVGSRYGGSGSNPRRGWLVKLDANCKVLGSKEYKEGGEESYLRGIAKEGGGGAWIIGSTKHIKIEMKGFPPTPKKTTSWRGWVKHINPDMNSISNHIFGSTSKKTYFDDVAVAPDQRVLVVGRTDDNSNNKSTDGSAVLLDKSGKTMYWKRYGTSASDYFWSVALDGNSAWMVGRTDASKSTKQSQRWLVKIDRNSGNVQADKKPGGSLNEWATDIAIKGGLRVVTGRARFSGKSHDSAQVMLMTDKGDLSKYKSTTETSGLADWDGVAFLNDGRIVVAGQIYDKGTKKQNPWAGYLGSSLESSCN